MSIYKKLALAVVLIVLFAFFTGIFVIYIASGQILSALVTFLGYILSVVGIAHLTLDQLD